jgi:hypothetical protein
MVAETNKQKVEADAVFRFQHRAAVEAQVDVMVDRSLINHGV